MAVSRLGGGVLVPRQRRFLSSQVWTVPVGVTWVKARIVGGGASGLLYVSGGFQQVITGTGGAEVIDAILAVTPGAAMQVTVAPNTLAPSVNNGTTSSGVIGKDGAISSFGGVVARGGIAKPRVSAGIGSGYGADANASGSGVDAGSGIDFYGAGSASQYPGNFNSNPGNGGVSAMAVNVNVPDTTVTGIDAPSNTGSAGGSLVVYLVNNVAIGSARGGNGGSGIVILDWEEYA